MGIFRQSSEKKREKEIRQEARELTKELAAVGFDKKLAKDYLEKMQDILIDGCVQRDIYVQSKVRMEESRKLIEELLATILQKTPVEICTQLKALVEVLSGVYHECTIRKDDMDFASTYSYISKAAQNYDGKDRVMLQSELENLLHVMVETVEWEEPDFCALACFCKYGNRADLAEIENHQRNEMIVRFYHQQFWDEFEKELMIIGKAERVAAWMKERIERREDI